MGHQHSRPLWSPSSMGYQISPRANADSETSIAAVLAAYSALLSRLSNISTKLASIPSSRSTSHQVTSPPTTKPRKHTLAQQHRREIEFLDALLIILCLFVVVAYVLMLYFRKEQQKVMKAWEEKANHGLGQTEKKFTPCKAQLKATDGQGRMFRLLPAIKVSQVDRGNEKDGRRDNDLEAGTYIGVSRMTHGSAKQ